MTIQFQQTTQTTTGTTVIIPVAQEQGTPSRNTLAAVAAATQLPTTYLEQLFAAKASECCPVVTPHGIFILVGLGDKPSPATIFKGFQQLGAKHEKLLGDQVLLSWLHDNTQPDVPALTEAAVSGLWQGSYFLGRYKTDNGTTHAVQQEGFRLQIALAEADRTATITSAQRGLVLGQAQTEVMALVNAPANLKQPQDLAKWAVDSGKKYGFRTEIWDKKRITEEGMHALLAVNQGSPEPPVFIIMEYQGKTTKGHLPKIGLVGKGVTFDTGGLSIKPSSNMHYMKSDMGGAAAVLGTMEAAARLQLPIHLIGVIPSTDNSVDALAVKPSDVISSYSGKSIEIIDTDAEGRLVLADGLSYIIRQHHPDIVIDLATLTGASVRTFGYQAGALFSNDDQLAHHLEQAGQRTGERVWRLPLWEEYAEEMKSDVADIKNFSGRPVAGAISAAKFLEFFTDNHPSWAHLDIAGVAFGDTPFTNGKAATGYGIRLLIQFLITITQE
ncbi:MAG: leucyl aminopeptidase [Bacteroidetes bacterium]|nr:MAG: leucyl aminopeptidase [Bacteroidota bacterium]PTM12326.1 MAG: leucyl aminopeptidase [Bacteroidota bacterium]